METTQTDKTKGVEVKASVDAEAVLLLKECLCKMTHYTSATEEEINEVKRAIRKVDVSALPSLAALINKTARRMSGMRFRGANNQGLPPFYPNQSPGAHYPAVQPLLDRIGHFVKQTLNEGAAS